MVTICEKPRHLTLKNSSLLMASKYHFQRHLKLRGVFLKWYQGILSTSKFAFVDGNIS